MSGAAKVLLVGQGVERGDVERGSSPGGALLRAASAQNSPSFCQMFLVNFNDLPVKPSA